MNLKKDVILKQKNSNMVYSNFSDADCKSLCMRAEELMQMSAAKEHTKDLASALVMCQQAIGIYFTLICEKVFPFLKHMCSFKFVSF